MLVGLGVAIPWRHRAQGHAPRAAGATRRSCRRRLPRRRLRRSARWASGSSRAHKWREPVGPPPSAAYAGRHLPGVRRAAARAAGTARRATARRWCSCTAAAATGRGAVGHARMLARHGYGVLLYDARGRGESEGGPTTTAGAGPRTSPAALDVPARPAPTSTRGASARSGCRPAPTCSSRSPPDARRHRRARRRRGRGRRSFEDSAPPARRRDRRAARAGSCSRRSRSSRATPRPAARGPRRRLRTPDAADLRRARTEEREFNVLYDRAAGAEPRRALEPPHASHTRAIRQAPAAYERRVVGFLDRALLRDAPKKGAAVLSWTGDGGDPAAGDDRGARARAARPAAGAHAARRAPARPAARQAAPHDGSGRRAATLRGSSARSSGARRGSRGAARRCPTSPTRRSCRSAPGATTCWRRSATTRSSSSRARPARARRPSCRRSASSSGAACAARSATRSRGGSPRARSPSASPTSSTSPLGEAVGFAVRFSDRSSEDTLVRLMTDGLLLAEIQRDRLLRRYDTIIVDEAHERSLNIDFLLGLLKRILPAPAGPEADRHVGDDRPRALRRALRRRAGHRGLRPHVPGRGPLPAVVEPDDEDADRDQTDAIGDAVEELLRERPRRHPRVPLRRARDPRHRRRARAAGCAPDDRDPAAVRAPVERRAAAGVQARTRPGASCSPPTSPRRR